VSRRFPVAALVFALASACGGARPEPAAHPEPLVHRFTDPERWSKRFDDPARDAWQKPADVVGLMRIAPGMTVADVGAGTGYFEPYLSRAVGPAGVVLAVDIEPEMVRWLQDRSAREHWANVRPQLGDTSDPKLPAGRVDRVLVVDTWHHIPERSTYAGRLRSVLAPAGTITIVEFTLDAPEGPPKPHRLAPAALIDELRAAGFAAEQVDAGLPYQYVVVAR
jgi:predicted methyltransferase